MWRYMSEFRIMFKLTHIRCYFKPYKLLFSWYGNVLYIQAVSFKTCHLEYLKIWRFKKKSLEYVIILIGGRRIYQKLLLHLLPPAIRSYCLKNLKLKELTPDYLIWKVIQLLSLFEIILPVFEKFRIILFLDKEGDYYCEQ